MKPASWCLSLAALWLLGCGPEAGAPDDGAAWVYAGLSNAGSGSIVTSVVQWDFEDDGTAIVTTFETAGGCGSHTRTKEYRWSEAGPGAVEITDPDGGPKDSGGGTSWDRVVFEIGDGCDRMSGQAIDEVHFRDGSETSRDEAAYVRGKVCLEDLPPCPPDQVECDSCRATWCDGEPPELFECGR